MLPRLSPISFSSIPHVCGFVDMFEKDEDRCHGGHLGYQNETILAILYLNFALISLV